MLHYPARDGEKPRLVADLGDKTSPILRNHGLLTMGETAAEAFVSMYYLGTSCAIQVRAQSGGGELIPAPREVIPDLRACAVGNRVERRLTHAGEEMNERRIRGGRVLRAHACCDLLWREERVR